MFGIFRKISLTTGLLVGMFVVFASVSGVAQKMTDAKILENAKKMEKIIREGMDKIKIPAVTLSISRAGKPLYFKAFGQTTLPQNNPEPVSEKTLFPVSSVSKNVTAILVGALVDDGKISFDDKVRKYYPEFFVCTEEMSNEFTIRDLISHSSGLKHFSGDTLFKAGFDNEQILRAFRFLKQRPGEFRKVYGYQNIIFGIAGIVLERATGERYEDLVQKYIFDKMGMENSSAIRLDAEASRLGYFKYLLSRFSHDSRKLGFFQAALNLITKTVAHKPKQVVINHSRSFDEIIPLEQIGFFQRFSATSGISFSAEDFAKWCAMLANRGTFNGQQIVSQETFAKLTSNIAEVRNIKDDDVTFVKTRFPRENMFYGMGIFKSPYFDNGKNAHNILFHMGGVYGSTAFFAVSPDDDLAVGVICNLGGIAQTLFCEYMVNQFLDLSFGFSKIDWVQADIDRKNFFHNKVLSMHQDLSERNPTPMGDASDYVGTYSSELYGDIVVSEEGGNLVIDNGIRRARLTHINGGTFSCPSRDICLVFFDELEYVSFTRNENNAITSCYISCFDENKTAFQKKNG
ncbi:MAG: serine hydrolase [Alphaproteobacteria bacterium]|nr:serine hydrolase [Alphaproteobacteria bacterium]